MGLGFKPNKDLLNAIDLLGKKYGWTFILLCEDVRIVNYYRVTTKSGDHFVARPGTIIQLAKEGERWNGLGPITPAT